MSGAVRSRWAAWGVASSDSPYACVASGRNRSLMSNSSAFASASMLSTAMFRSPRSTEPTYVRCSPASSANASWLMPFVRRADLSSRAKRCLADSTMVRAEDIARESAFQMTIGLQTISSIRLKCDLERHPCNSLRWHDKACSLGEPNA
jgi:hypothetical protein